MKRAVVLVVPLLFAACASSTMRSGDRTTVLSRLESPLGLGGEAPDLPQTRTITRVTASARILSDSEARAVYGADLAREGIQAVWMRIGNRTATDQWMLAAHLDPDHFTADEAAHLFRSRFSGTRHATLQQRFRDLSMRARIGAGETHEGHVLVPRREGGRYVEITTNGNRTGPAFRIPLTNT